MIWESDSGLALARPLPPLPVATGINSAVKRVTRHFGHKTLRPHGTTDPHETLRHRCRSVLRHFGTKSQKMGHFGTRTNGTRHFGTGAEVSKDTSAPMRRTLRHQIQERRNLAPNVGIARKLEG